MGELVSNLGGSEGQKLLGALALIVGFGFIFVQSQARWNERGLFARLQEWSRQNRVHVGWALIIFVVGFLTPLVSEIPIEWAIWPVLVGGVLLIGSMLGGSSGTGLMPFLEAPKPMPTLCAKLVLYSLALVLGPLLAFLIFIFR